jgi:hypothetical protein
LLFFSELKRVPHDGTCDVSGDGRSRTYDTADMSRML